MFTIIIGIIVFLFTVEVKPEECITPNKEKAECVSLYSCSVLIDALATKQESAIEFLRQSNCGGTAINPMVCCGSSGNFTVESEKSLPNITEKINLLPTRRFCGFQHSDDYISTDHNVLIPTITEFPWLAGLAYDTYRSDKSLEILCGGSLINRKYVITAAHCSMTAAYGPPVAVYLGEYHINNKTDCVREPPFEEECSTPVELFGIEKAIPHPKYSPRKKNNDIALLRLNRTVIYSDYIRPICLPLPGTTFAKIGDVLISSGWGRTHFAGDRTEIKKKVFTRLTENERCMQVFKNRSIIVDGNHLCTVSNENDSNVECQGDSGGPLLFSHRHQWHQEGVISYGIGCGGNYPQLYTKVANYIDWILENIEK